MSKKIDMTNKTIGRLKVLEEGPLDRDKRATWICECDCGNIKTIRGKLLRNGRTKSCGCLSREVAKRNNTTHGKSKHPLYGVWCNIISRTENKNVPNFRVYGGRGIKMCDTWRKDFNSFFEWAIKHGWKKGLDVDRIDTDGGYAPNNCRIVTREINCANRSESFNGKPLGVNIDKRTGRWTAQLRYKKVLHWIGTFDTQLEAIKARNEYIVNNSLHNTLNKISKGE